MRKLTSVAFVALEGPLGTGFLELGQLTVLTGVNDSGKTRMLRVIEEALARPHQARYVNLFGIATVAKIEKLVDPGAAVDPEKIEWLDDLVDGDMLRDQLELPDLDDGTRIAITPNSYDVLEAWRWGRAWSELPAELQARVEQLDTGQLSDHADEPLRIALLGAARVALLPEPIVVPVADEQLRQVVEVSVSGLCDTLRQLGHNIEDLGAEPGEFDGIDSDWYPEYGPDWSATDPPSRSSLLLETDDNSDGGLVKIHPAARQACAVIERIARHLLPRFVTENYELHIDPASPREIAAGRRALAIQLKRSYPALKDAGDDDDDDELEEYDVTFDVSDAASGYALWLQLVLLEAAARIRTLTQLLVDAQRQTDYPDPSQKWSEPDPDMLEAIPPEPDPDTDDDTERGDRETRLADARRLIIDTLQRLTDPETQSPELTLPPPLPEPDEAPLGYVPPAGWVSDYRTRLYLIDEPEQRLHPALARRSAGWLAAAMERWGTQCVLATHSTAFMDLPGDLRLYELERDGDYSTLKQLNLSEITPRSQFARTMGFDRGELLSRWQAFLVVQTQELADILQALAADRLHDSRIRLVTLSDQDADNDPAELALLTEFTTAPVTVLVSAAPQAAGGHRGPVQAAHQPHHDCVPDWIGRLHASGLPVETISLDVPGALDLLDADTIRRTAQPTTPTPFPGHQQAHQAHAVTGQHTGSDDYREFVQTRYEIPTDPNLVHRVAKQMRLEGLPLPPPLDEALWRVEQMILDAESRRPYKSRDEPGRTPETGADG